MNVNYQNNLNALRQLGTLAPGDECIWEGEQVVIKKRTFWDELDKFIRIITPCISREPEVPFRPMPRTLQNIANLIQAFNFIPAHHNEDLRRLKLYIANPEWASPLVAHTLNVMNQSLIRHRPGNVPAELLQRIAGYDRSSNTYRALRQVSVSCNNALSPLSLATTSFFKEATSGSRRAFVQLFHFLSHLERNQRDGRAELLRKFFIEATPQGLHLYYEYMFQSENSNMRVALERNLYVLPPLCSTRSEKTIELSALRDVTHPEKITSLVLWGKLETPQQIDFSILIERFTNLRKLHFKNIAISKEQVVNLGALPLLEKLTLSHPQELETIKAFPKLTQLSDLVICPKQSAAKALCELVNGKLLNLKRLSVLSPQSEEGKRHMALVLPFPTWNTLPEITLSAQGAIEIMRQCPQLVAIDIGEFEFSGIEARHLQQALQNAPNLEQLVLAINGSGVELIWSTLLQLPKLRMLSLYTDCVLPTISLALENTQLEALTVSSGSTWSVTRNISKLKNLTYLALRGRHQRADIASIAKCQKLQVFRYFQDPHLPHLEIFNEAVFDDRSLEQLACLPNLREIHLEGRHHVSAEGALRFLRSHPYLWQISGFSSEAITRIPQALHIKKDECFALIDEV